MTRDEVSELKRQLDAGEWKWVKVKRDRSEELPTAQERYEALKEHHVRETTFLIGVIRDLCETALRGSEG
jgi:hypothetical protein